MKCHSTAEKAVLWDRLLKSSSVGLELDGPENWMGWSTEGLNDVTVSHCLFFQCQPKKVKINFLVHQNVRNGHIYIKVMKQHIP